MFNEGHHARDFTYIDDIVEGVLRTADRVAAARSRLERRRIPTRQRRRRALPALQHRQQQARRADALHRLLEKALGREAKKNFLPMQPGDVPETYADVDDLVADVGFKPATPIEDGIAKLR